MAVQGQDTTGSTILQIELTGLNIGLITSFRSEYDGIHLRNRIKSVPRFELLLVQMEFVATKLGEKIKLGGRL